jgi:Lrp/AsnC family transcriptional regulator, leucine-responsive regulatory protein
MIDNKDLLILNELSKDAKQKTKNIAKKLEIPITTTHNRIKKLEQENIIKKYTIEIDNKKINKNITSILMINLNFQKIQTEKTNIKDIAKQISKYKQVKHASLVTGEYDLILNIITKDIEELQKFIFENLHNNKYIQNTRTLISLENYTNNIQI